MRYVYLTTGVWNSRKFLAQISAAAGTFSVPFTPSAFPRGLHEKMSVFETHRLPDTARRRDVVSIASFNILAPKFCDERYHWLSDEQRQWANRRERILREMIAVNAGVCCIWPS